jgi:hypothetical protein
MNNKRLETNKIKVQCRKVGKYSQHFITIPSSVVYKQQLQKGDIFIVESTPTEIILIKESLNYVVPPT